ncbi:hypothetical protein [Nocardioides nitrophenolicus]|uniref:hypothetical protein n=1 Tax=Nocardioides nitrophenolicus TaxID=60489 RepID=UPI0019596E9A|nr:hypothetical protein [Nocardioides nitrophenolicus]MBM7516961.1 hypothetical protein [Nocardioides nitrophenolicus]
MGRALLAAAALVLSPVVLVPAPPGSAAPGGDAVVVTQSFTLSTTDQQGMSTVMCPAGMRATGGGAAPTPPASLTVDIYRVFYSAPVDGSGLAGSTDAGDVPRGWQVSVGNFGPRPQTFKAFVICSAGSDAVLAAAQPAQSGTLDVVVPCPAGSRAIGGGVGKINDTAIPGTEVANPLHQTGPVGPGPGYAGDGVVAVGWRTVVDSTPAYGDRFFAVCSAASDAVVRSTSYTLPMADNQAGGAAVACPAGSRALSGGQGNAGAYDAEDRVALMGPFTSIAELDGIGSGAVGRGWSAYGQSSSTQARTNQVFAVCATDTTPPDTTPPDTTIHKHPKKRTSATRARFTFGSEPGVTFTCRLDKREPKACASPYRVKKLKRGKHKVTITATDAAGNVDPTPARFSWRVVR